MFNTMKAFKMLDALKKVLKCAMDGHEAFDFGATALPVFIQSKNLGNKTQTVMVCKHCLTVFCKAGELSKEDLAKEAAVEENMRQLKEKLLEKVMHQNQTNLQKSDFN